MEHGTWNTVHGTSVALVTAARFQFGQFVLIVPDRKKGQTFPLLLLLTVVFFPGDVFSFAFFSYAGLVFPLLFHLERIGTALWDREPRNGNFPKRLFNSRAEFVHAGRSSRAQFVSFSPERAAGPMLLVKSTVFHLGTSVFRRSTR